jgi:hypothetical protein
MSANAGLASLFRPTEQNRPCQMNKYSLMLLA